MTKPFYQQSAANVLKSLGVSEHGLSEQEVKNQREKFGLNELQEADRKTVFQVFFEQF